MRGVGSAFVLLLIIAGVIGLALSAASAYR